MYSPGGRIGPPVARATYRRHTRINVAARARAAQRDAEWLTLNSKQVNAAETSRSDAGALLSRRPDQHSPAGADDQRSNHNDRPGTVTVQCLVRRFFRATDCQRIRDKPRR